MRRWPKAGTKTPEPTWAGFVYVAFAIDLFLRATVGWQVSTVKDTSFVEACLRMAFWRRDHTGHPIGPGMIHRSDAGGQYTSVLFAETVALEGLNASIATVATHPTTRARRPSWACSKSKRSRKTHPPARAPKKTRGCRRGRLGLGELVQQRTTNDSTTCWATSRPRNTTSATTIKISAYQPVTPRTKRRHKTRDGSPFQQNDDTGGCAQVLCDIDRWPRRTIQRLPPQARAVKAAEIDNRPSTK